MILNTVKTYLRDFVGLFYPHLCLACGYNLSAGDESNICISCEYHMVKTHFHLKKTNEFTDRLAGRVPLHSATALYYFIKDTPVQKMLHKLKYSNKPEIGIEMGQLYGAMLIDSPIYHDIDVIVPVPLHPRKEHKRGYNQSIKFGEGLADAMRKPMLKDGLIKVELNESQTRKNRMERAENTQDMYELNPMAKLEGKHILLVDDVMTTGATIEACVLPLLTIPNVKISVATIAIAK